MLAASPSELDETGLPGEGYGGYDDEDMAAPWFLDDLHEDLEGAPSEDELHSQLCASVRGLLFCDSDADHVARQVLALKCSSPAMSSTESFAAALSKLCPCRRVYIREAKGSPVKSLCLTRLRHKCIVVSRPQAWSSSPRSPLRIADEPLIVETALKDSLAIADPTPRYQALLDLLPEVYVATDANFMATLQLVADEMKASFAENHKEMPPWRTYPALASKWSSHTSIDTPLRTPQAPATARAPAARSAAPERDVRQPPAPAHGPGTPAPTTSITIAKRPPPRAPPPTPYPFQPPCMVPSKQPARPVAARCTTTTSSSSHAACAGPLPTTAAAPTTRAAALAPPLPPRSTVRRPPQLINPATSAPATEPPPPITMRLSQPAPHNEYPTSQPSPRALWKPPAPRSGLQAFFPLHTQPPALGHVRPHLLVNEPSDLELPSCLTTSLRATAAGPPTPAGRKGAVQIARCSSAGVAAGPAAPLVVGHGSVAESPGYCFLAEVIET